MKKGKFHRGLSILVLRLVPILASLSLAVSSAMAQDDCKTKIAEAEQKYQTGQLEEAINLLVPCVNQSSMAIGERVRACKLLAKAYHSKEQLDSAKAAIRQLLKLQPNWRPDPEIDTPSFRELAKQVINEIKTSSSGSKKWWWIGGGGVLAAGAVTYLVFREEEKTKRRLPYPPDLP